MIPTPTQWADIALIKQAIASRPGLAWIKPSYICAEVSIESGWDPLAVNGSSLGLMQAKPGTVSDVIRLYKLIGIGPQTDPYSSLIVGICYFDLCARQIIASRPPQELHLGEIAQAYQKGYAGYILGERNARYEAKMLAQQIIWAPLVDVTPPPVVVPPVDMNSDVVFDASHWETREMDFAAAVAGGMVAGIFKATQGIGFTDNTFLPRIAAARNAGLLVGAYHFMDASDPPSQIAHFLTVAVTEGRVSWLALDWESNPASQADVSQVAQAAALVQSATGRWPVLYAGRPMLSAPSATLSNCALWLPEYGSNPIPPLGFATWELWQHTDGQVGSNVVPVPGIGPCSRSKFAGTIDQLRAWWGSTAFASREQVVWR